MVEAIRSTIVTTYIQCDACLTSFELPSPSWLDMTEAELDSDALARDQMSEHQWSNHEGWYIEAMGADLTGKTYSQVTDSDLPTCCGNHRFECYNEMAQHGSAFNEDNPRMECADHCCDEVIEGLQMAHDYDKEEARELR